MILIWGKPVDNFLRINAAPIFLKSIDITLERRGVKSAPLIRLYIRKDAILSMDADFLFDWSNHLFFQENEP